MANDERSYEDQIIEAAKQGFMDSITPLPAQFENLLRLVYRAGYHEAERNRNGFSGCDD